MISFPNCKINLGLRVLQKRSDGFHNIETVFYPVPFRDVIEIIAAPALPAVTIENYGLPVLGAPSENLCVKAWQLLRADFPGLPVVAIHLLKQIPMGAGLGGGSADGAFMLRLLNHKFHLGITQEQLMGYALRLGSDCPFFINNKPCFATGRGDILENISLSLAGWYLVLVQPGIHVHTGQAFAALHKTDAPAGASNLLKVISQPISSWKDQLVNDFEQPVFEQYPVLQSIKENLYTRGAVYASMSGSGSTVYGLFRQNVANEASFPAHHTVIKL